MAKYNYDKSVLKGLGVKPFLNEVKVRNEHIEAADTTPPKSIYNSNVLAKELHPSPQFLVVDKVIDRGSAKEFILKAKKGSVAYFRAGQYLSVVFPGTTRPYTIASCPSRDSYSLIIKAVPGGKCSNYAFENWKSGTEVVAGPPVGKYYYTSLRDAKHVVALAGGSGITPFYSMAKAIEAGIEDFNLTILYGSKLSKDILLKDELDEICKNTDKVKVVHVLSDEKKRGYEHGFIDAELIKKYTEGDYSVFVCGPPAMYQFIGGELAKLKLPIRRIRLEVPGESFDISRFDLKDVKHKAKVHVRGEINEYEISEQSTILRGLEEQGVVVPADCRSGKCGWCRSRLISGDVFFPQDNRRMADRKFGWIHPCCTYAKSDIEIEVYPTY